MNVTILQSKIYEIRNLKIMLDFDLAELYETPTKALNQAVKRNSKRFPPDFMFQLTSEEWTMMRSQIVTTSLQRRNSKAIPYAFTEQGVAMLSGILNSDVAINVNIAIMRTFVMIRKYALNHQDIRERLTLLEKKYDDNFGEVFKALHHLLQKEENQKQATERKQIGYKNNEKD
jgi:hypothetical protein